MSEHTQPETTVEVPKNEEKKPMKKNNTIKTKQAFGLGILIFIILLCVGGVFYVKSAVNNLSEEPSIVAASKVLGISVATVNGEDILYAEYIEDKKTLGNFYASEPSAPAISETQLSDQVLARLVANTLIAQIAYDRNISITDEDIEKTKAELLTQFPDEETLAIEIQTRYGWDLDTYITRVVKPALLEQKLRESYVAENTNPDAAKTTAEGVLAQILDGAEFAPLAAEYGSDGTKFQGGDLGYFTRGQMVPAFEEAAFALEPGTVSPELVETEFGYHIIKVEDKRTTTTPAGEEVEELRARHILFPFGGEEEFVDFMDTQFDQAEIRVTIEAVNNPFTEIEQENSLTVPAPESDTATEEMLNNENAPSDQ